MDVKSSGEISIGKLKVPRIGFGTMQLPRLKDPSIAKKILRKAYDSGVRFFDTALFYGKETSNKYLVEELGKEKDAYFITKVGAKYVDNKGEKRPPIGPAQKPEELRENVLLNLKSLNLKKLDIVFLRHIEPGFFPGRKDQEIDFKLQLAEMVKMRDEGLIGEIALSNITLEQLKYALPFGIVAVQNLYNLLNRKDEPVLEFCQKNKIPYLPYFPLGGAMFMNKVFENPVVIEIAKEMKVTPSQVGLAWLLQHSDNMMLIAGTASLEHLEENNAVGNIKISDENMKKLDNIAPPK